MRNRNTVAGLVAGVVLALAEGMAGILGRHGHGRLEGSDHSPVIFTFRLSK